MNLRQEHKRWHDVEIGHMVTTIHVINCLNTHWNRFKKDEDDLTRLIEDNMGRTDLIVLPPTPKTCGLKELEADSRTLTDNGQESPPRANEQQQAMEPPQETPKPDEQLAIVQS